MENNLQKTTSETSLTVKAAIQSPIKIKNCSVAQIKEQLAYAFAVMGITGPAIPNQVLEAVLLDFIYTKFAHYSLLEIRMAFQMAACGDLNVDCNHYGTFSPEYFARIMKGYNEHRQKEAVKLSNDYIKEKPDYVPDTAEKLQIQKEFDETCIVPLFDKWLKYNFIDNGAVPLRIIFNSLIHHHKIMEFTKDQREAIYKSAKEVIKERRIKMVESKAATYAQHKEKMKMIEALELPETLDEQTKNECYRICIERAFQKLKDNQKHFKDLI